MNNKFRTFLKILLVMSCLAGLVFGSTAVAGPAAQEIVFVAPRLVVNTSFLNVRSGPGIEYPVLLTVVGGTEFPVLARASDNVWFQVSTVVGVGWINVQYTVPRGSFDKLPVINRAAIPGPAALSLPATLGLLDQGGGATSVTSTATAATTPPTGGVIRVVYDGGRRVTSVSPGERFRARIDVEAVNLRSQPSEESPSVGTIFRDDSNDYVLLGSSRDKRGFDWLAIDVPDLGVGWVEAPKVFLRLSRLAGDVLVLKSNVSLTDAPGGSGLNLPVLSPGQEAFLIDISRDSNFVQIELPDGLRGWVPFESVQGRGGTPTDLIDLTQIPRSAMPGMTAQQASGAAAVAPAMPQQPRLDTPRVVINTGFLNVRSGPGAQYSIVATIPGGAELPVIGIASDQVWYLVQGPFGQGWVNSEFTLFRGNINSVPIIRNAMGTLAAPVAVVTNAVQIYAAPGTNFGIIGTLSGPVEAPVVARTFDSVWVQLNTSLGFGWVLASQVILRGDLNLVPTVG